MYVNMSFTAYISWCTMPRNAVLIDEALLSGRLWGAGFGWIPKGRSTHMLMTGLLDRELCVLGQLVLIYVSTWTLWVKELLTASESSVWVILEWI